MKNDQIFMMKLFELLNETTKTLPSNDVRNITEFIENGEWGLAYEILCIQLYEYDIQISRGFYEKISSLGKSIGIQSSIWLPLKKLITNNSTA